MTRPTPSPPSRPVSCLSPAGAGASASPRFIPAAEYVARLRAREARTA